jgi:hypothetical protein
VEGCYGLAYALPVGYGWRAGINIKGLQNQLEQTSATGWGLDLGLLWSGWNGFSAGLDVRDVYTRLWWATGYAEAFPTTCKLGAAYRWAPGEQHALLVTADAEQSLSRRPARLRAGAEYGFADTLFLRAGYDDGLPAAGAGLRLPWVGWARMAVRVDYALVQDAIDGWDHWLTLKLDF